MIAMIGAIAFAFLAAVLYLCTLGTMASEPVRTEADLEKQSVVAIGGAVLVFALVLWLRLEAS